MNGDVHACMKQLGASERLYNLRQCEIGRENKYNVNHAGETYQLTKFCVNLA